MAHRPQALLTNDDGVHAPGLEVLVEAISRRMEVTIVAPDQHLSGCGHQVTVDRALKLEQLESHRFALDGTPADCVRVGLHRLDHAPDWVFAGVNAGGNLGVDTYMSGTVAAVREAAMWGIPAIAFSQYHRSPGPIDWQSTRDWIDHVLAQLLTNPPGAGSFWNVNFPDPPGSKPESEPPELVHCPLDPHPHDVSFEVANQQYRFQGVYQNRRRIAGTDVDCCFSGQIAVTRLHLTGHDDPVCDLEQFAPDARSLKARRDQP